MFHSIRGRNYELGLSNGGDTVKAAEYVRFLGLELDDELPWESHCISMGSRLYKYLYLVGNLRFVLQRRTLLGFYHAQIELQDALGRAVHAKKIVILTV